MASGAAHLGTPTTKSQPQKQARALPPVLQKQITAQTGSPGYGFCPGGSPFSPSCTSSGSCQEKQSNRRKPFISAGRFTRGRRGEAPTTVLGLPGMELPLPAAPTQCCETQEISEVQRRSAGNAVWFGGTVTHRDHRTGGVGLSKQADIDYFHKQHQLGQKTSRRAKHTDQIG